MCIRDRSTTSLTNELNLDINSSNQSEQSIPDIDQSEQSIPNIDQSDGLDETIVQEEDELPPVSFDLPSIPKLSQVCKIFCHYFCFLFHAMFSVFFLFFL